MIKSLRTLYLNLPLIIAVLLCSSPDSLYAQVELTNIQSVEIRFTLGQTQVQNNTYTVNTEDIHTLVKPEFKTEGREWVRFSEEGTTGLQTYQAEEGRSQISVRGVSVEGNERAFFPISANNSSGREISSLFVSFDFIYNPSLITENETFTLYYSVNDGTPRRADGVTIQARQLRDSENEWKTFSLQLNLDDIYLRGNDIVHLIWESDKNQNESTTPLFVQRVEMVPEESRLERVSRGEVIITEIMPLTEVDGVRFEYFELYNPGNREINLRGSEVKTNNGTYVIQQNLLIPPYDMLVLSNVDISELEGVRNFYLYRNEFLPHDGGRIEITQQQQIIASATYEPGEPGIAYQLDEVIQAYDGYTSLSNLRVAERSFFPDLFGSPGSFGDTNPLYRRTLQREGWYFIAPPGSLQSRLNRSSSLTFYTLEGEVITPDQAEPFIPLFIYKEGNEPFTLYAEGTRERSMHQHSLHQKEAGGGYLTAVSQPVHTSLARILNSNDLPVPPYVNKWNERLMKFEISTPDEVDFLNWEPVLMNSRLEDRQSTTGSSTVMAELERYIAFSLYRGEGNSRRMADQALLGFLPQPTGEQRRYDLPKLSAEVNMIQGGAEVQPYIYLTSPESRSSVNSFLHLPYEISDEYQVGLGFKIRDIPAASGTFSVDWRIPSEIPDEWVLILHDLRTGNRVDMREESSYRFRYNQPEVERQADETAISMGILRPEDRNRFSVEIKPFQPVIQEEEEDTQPGTVQLRQNYPNPFNPSTNITFYLPEERNVRVGIYNIVGQQVALLMDDNMQAGEHSVIWDATNNPSGIYIVQLETGNRILTRKITLIK